MRLYFIRHGQSTNNELTDRTGSERGRSEDAGLTEKGHRQAELLGRYLASPARFQDPPGMDSKDLLGFSVTHLYCSLMDRAIRTGTYLSRALDLPLVALTDAHESGGIYLDDNAEGQPVGQPGRNRKDLLAAYPHLRIPDEVGDEGWWNRPFEEKQQRPARAQRVLDLLLRMHGGTEDRVGLVSHGGFFNWLMMRIIGFTDPDRVWLHTNNASISRIDFYADIMVVQYVNRTEHLPPDLIT